VSLANNYVLAVSRIPDLFSKIRDGQAPERFTGQLLKDLGFVSSNDRAFIPLLKTLGFLTADGNPTQRYHDYRDHSRSEAVMGDALKEAYEDVFLIKARPTEADKTAISGKFKSYHNVSDRVAGLMCTTFFALLNLADLSGSALAKTEHKKVDVRGETEESSKDRSTALSRRIAAGLYYNIQIHLPATKDIEVYNAIFRSIKEHLIVE
jgi:Family of unknown function (DUF5343)